MPERDGNTRYIVHDDQLNTDDCAGPKDDIQVGAEPQQILAYEYLTRVYGIRLAYATVLLSVVDYHIYSEGT